MIEPVSKTRPMASETLEAPPKIYVRADVLDEIRFNGRWRRDGLAGGLLVGHHFKDPADASTYLVVDGFVGGSHADSMTGFIRELRERWKDAVAARASHLPDSEIVGWYVAPGDAEAEPDAEALLLHNSFFNHPWQAGLWVRPDAEPVAIDPEGDRLQTGAVAVLDGDRARPAKPR